MTFIAAPVSNNPVTTLFNNLTSAYGRLSLFLKGIQLMVLIEFQNYLNLLVFLDIFLGNFGLFKLTLSLTIEDQHIESL